MESSAVALMSVLEGCDQAKLLSLSLGKGSHAGTPKLLGIITRWELVRNESRQSLLLCAAVQGGKGFTG